jgi:RHS repeat-associated protein
MPSLGYNDGNGWRSLYRDYKLLGTSFAGSAGLFMSDEKGSVHRFLDENDDWSDSSRDILYSHYGEVLSGKEGLDRTFGLGYTGLETASCVDTWRTTTREFAPSIGRFLSRDKDEFLRPENPSGLNQYQYCFGNPVIWVDPEGTDCYIFYLPEFESFAKRDQAEMAKQYGYDISQVHIIPINSKKDLTNGWNNMGVENGQNVDIDSVMIWAHGNPKALGNGNGDWQLKPGDIKKLQDKDIENLILPCCNAGHNDYQQKNIAAEFARKTDGAPVIATDGTGYAYQDGTLESRYDDHFKEWLKYGDRDNDGWLVYHEDDGEVNVSKLGKKFMTVEEMMATLKKYDKKYRCTMSGGGPSAGGEVDWDTQPA